MNEKKYISSKEEIDAFIDNAISQIKEPDLDFDKWDVAYFIEALPLRKFLSSQRQLVGKTIDRILAMGCIFNQDEIDEGNETEYLCLDEPVVIIIGNVQFEVWCYTNSRVKIGINSLTLKEKSYQPYAWRDCSDLFNEGIIGQRITGFDVESSKCGFYDSLGLGDRSDGGDYFESFCILLESDKRLTFYGSEEYMGVTVNQ